MNKDVIYIAPEDDITDIISKIKGASQKIVAIVPPQSSGVFRSAVNIKLIVKTAEEVGRVPVLVTSDPALLKLAAASHLPVTENLQTPPSIPTDEDLEARASTPEKEAKIAEDFVKPPKTVEKVIESTEVEKEIVGKTSEEQSAEDDSEEDSDENQEKSKSQKTKKPSIFSKLYEKFPWIEKNRKILAVALIVLVLLAGFCVWAFAFAPAVDITLAIRTSGNNFSESVSFTTKEAEENVSSGKFYLKAETFESEPKVQFNATGKKDVGNKASGTVTVSLFFSGEGSVTIPANTTFTYGGLNYQSTSDTVLKWAQGSDSCENKGDSSSLVVNGCKISGKVKISAAEPGANYNLDSGKKDWNVSANIKTTNVKSVSVENTEAISGGTSRVVTVVQQSDVDAARANFSTMEETDGKKQLFDKIPDSVFVLENTYKASNSNPVVSPKVGEEVPEGTTPTISAKSTFSVYVVENSKIEEFISSKVTIGSDQKIYSAGSPFIEYFNGSGDNYTGKLKTTFKTGPNFSKDDVINKVLGRKTGEVQSLLKSINGIDSVQVNSSYFWVSRVPTDPSRVTIRFKVDGEEIENLDELKNSKNDSKNESQNENQNNQTEEQKQ